MRYGAAGLIGTATHFCVLGGLARGAGLGLVAASTWGAVSGACVNYYLNHRHTFASRRRHREALPAYWGVATAGFVLNAAVLALLHGAGRLSAVPAQILATATVLVAGFFANRRWTFR